MQSIGELQDKGRMTVKEGIRKDKVPHLISPGPSMGFFVFLITIGTDMKPER